MLHPLLATALSVFLVAAPSFAGDPASADEGGSASDPVIDKIIDTGLNRSQVMDHLHVLCDEIGPRLTGSRGLQRACLRAREMFESFGLDARLEEWGEFPVGFDRGPWYGRVLEPMQMELVCATNAWTPGTFGPVRGPAVLAPTEKDDLATLDKAAYAGRWVLQPPRQRRRGRGRGEGGDGPSFAERLKSFYAEAGIHGVVQASSNELLVTGGNRGIKWDDLPTNIEIKLVRSQYEEVAKQVKDGLEVILEFDIENHFLPGPVKLYNVIADLKGSEFPDEYVIVGGHIDSWDGARGATDNGTGCATALEAARLLAEAGARPRRTIRFMLWSGEEQGLLGSKAYCAQNKELMPKISGVFVHDMGTNYLAGMYHTAAMADDMQKVFAAIERLPMKVGDEEFDWELKMRSGLSGGGSDHASFLKAGVPGFFWMQKGRAVYRYTHHTQHDFTDQVIPEFQIHSSTVLALSVYGCANLDQLLSRENLTAPRRRLGVGFEDDGVTVQTVTADGLAGKGGWKPGDKVIALDDKPVQDRSSLFRELFSGADRKVFTLKRGDEELKVFMDWRRKESGPVEGGGS